MNQKIVELLKEMNDHKNSYYDGLSLDKFTPEQIESMREYNTYTATEGKKYVKILNRGGVVAFIDADLNVYKPASWQSPAKHVRGNLNNSVRDGFSFEGLGLVFVKYLK